MAPNLKAFVWVLLCLATATTSGSKREIGYHPEYEQTFIISRAKSIPCSSIPSKE